MACRLLYARAAMLWKLTGGRHPGPKTVRCPFCRKELGVDQAGALQASAADLAAAGAVAVKRLGWFCGRRCVTLYEVRFRVVLEPESADAGRPGSA
ncbi:MAG TPA: hypothetical protein VEJ89_09185 [Myxococcaceae bacterium]|jgi:hypothetical protein|nr:hypothetical protein [Myxococcaceae bacterium]